MELTPIEVDTLVPPKDDLFAKIRASALTLKEHDVVAISSKVVAIGEGRCIPKEGVDVDALIVSEADQYLERRHTPGGYVMHTITHGTLIPNAGIDPFGGHYVLWPKDPMQSAEEIRTWLKKEYQKEHLYVVLTDSRSVFLRRGVVGMAVAWAGFEPVYDNRMRHDLTGEATAGSQTNLPDSLAAAAVLVMGEANESTPIVCIRNVPYVSTPQTGRKETGNSFTFPVKEDIFAPFMRDLPWRDGGRPA